MRGDGRRRAEVPGAGWRRDGLVGAAPEAFAVQCARLVAETETRLAMAQRAREAAEAATWDKVFEGVWAVYDACGAPVSVTAA